MKPSKKDIQTWIDALRSGEYKQTKGTLQDANGYCCLGVACDIFIPKEQQMVDLKGYLSGTGPTAQPSSPEWLLYMDAPATHQHRLNLVSLNDDLYFTFDEIADVLQAVYIEKVLS